MDAILHITQRRVLKIIMNFGQEVTTVETAGYQDQGIKPRKGRSLTEGEENKPLLY